jgi:hypothetical protein
MKKYFKQYWPSVLSGLQEYYHPSRFSADNLTPLIPLSCQEKGESILGRGVSPFLKPTFDNRKVREMGIPLLFKNLTIPLIGGCF